MMQVNIAGGNTGEPLSMGEYQAEYIGIHGQVFTTTIKFIEENAIIYSDTMRPNVKLEDAHFIKPADEVHSGDIHKYIHYNKETLKMIVDMEDPDMYMEGQGDPSAPAQPGDVVASKQFASMTFDVDIVLPNRKAFGVRDKGGQRCVIFYENVVLIQEK